MSRNNQMTAEQLEEYVAPREGRVSRNDYNRTVVMGVNVASREGHVSRKLNVLLTTSFVICRILRGFHFFRFVRIFGQGSMTIMKKLYRRTGSEYSGVYYCEQFNGV